MPRNYVVTSAMIGERICGGWKNKETRHAYKRQGLGCVGGGYMSKLRRKGWVSWYRVYDSDSHCITPEGLTVLKNHLETKNESDQ